MGLRKFIKTTIREYLNEQVSNNKETIEEFIQRFEVENPNKKFLEHHLKVPNFIIYLTHDGNIKFKKYSCSLPNKCEINTFNFIKDKVKINNHRYYPVSGWAFMESTSYFEHFWVYDAIEDVFLDVTPMNGDLPYAYGGVINYNINDEILNAKNYNDIPFLLGKVGHSLYKNYQNDEILPISKKQNKDIFNFISKSDKYKDLSIFVKDNNIIDMKDLKSYLHKLKDKRMTVRNNREYDYYTNLIQQIENLDI
jgi:hypothetical protein